jgi:hypothetical protein
MNTEEKLDQAASKKVDMFMSGWHDGIVGYLDGLDGAEIDQEKKDIYWKGVETGRSAKINAAREALRAFQMEYLLKESATEPF